MAILDPVLERLSGRHLPRCPIWHTEQVLDAHLCACPADPGVELSELLYADLVANLPHNAAGVRQRLAEAARHDPEQVHSVEDTLLRQVLANIASGDTPPEQAAGLARAALVATSGDRQRWCA
ncbi:MAG: hypothetical protein AB7W59_01780 [Acidimicrobiia bacterium]